MLDVESGSALDEPLLASKHFVTDVVMSLNGRRVVSGFSDGIVNVWKMGGETAQVELLLENKPSTSNQSHVAKVTSVAINADGQRVVCSCM